MKKRIVSLLIVTAMLFSGVFSVIASADDAYDFYWKIFDIAMDTLKYRDAIEIADMDNIVNHEEVSSDSSVNSRGDWSGNLDAYNRSINYFYSYSPLLSAGAYLSYFSQYFNISLDNCYYFMYCDNMGDYNRITFYICYDLSDSFDYTFDINKAYVTFKNLDYKLCSGQLVHKSGTFPFGDKVYPYALVYNNGVSSRNPVEFLNFYINDSQPYITNFQIEHNDLNWSSAFDQNGNNLETIVSCSGTSSVPDTSGYKISAGVVYHDYSSNVHGFPSADYVFCDLEDTRQVSKYIVSSKYTYNLKNLETLRKRKRMDHFNGFYAFVYVADPDGKEVHYNQQLINFDDVDDGIFSDVQDMPEHDDYIPEPTEYPSFPDIDFQFTPSNDYRTYNYQTINNYTYDTGEDLETNISNFYNWSSNSTQTVNNNVSNGFETVNHNINEFFNNVTNYFESTEDFINDGYTAVNDYLGDLIKKFNDDFNNWTESNTKYVGDCFDTLNHNITVIGDNIVNAIKSQLVPDQDVIFNIMIEKCQFFKQGYSALSSYEGGGEKNLVADIPFGIDERMEVTVNFTEQFSYFSRFRTLGVLFIYGSTFIAALNIIFKIFGLGWGSDSNFDD